MWTLILLGFWTLGIWIMLMKKTWGIMLCVSAPIFWLFYILLEEQYFIFLSIIGFAIAYSIPPCLWGKNEKKEESK